MKSYDEKWLHNLINPSEDVSKRYKALVSLKKFYKDQPDLHANYSEILNDQCKNVFYLVTEKLAKVPTSAFEQIVKLTSASHQLPEVLELLEDIFTLLGTPAIQELLENFKTRIIIILYKFLDSNTKREIRKTAFLFLLKIIESFQDFRTIEKEYIALFNYSFDSPALRENSQKPAYQLICSMGLSSPNNLLYKAAIEYAEQYNAFQDIGKLITENVMNYRPEDIVKDTFTTFHDFINIKKDKISGWLAFFQANWMDIFFNEHGIDDYNSFSIFEETKKKGLTKNLAVQKLFLAFLLHILKDESVVFSQQSLFIIIDVLKSFYWNIHLKMELNRILSILHLYVSNRFKLFLEHDFNDDITKKIIANLEDLLLHYILEEAASLSSPGPDHKEKEKYNEHVCLRILYDLLKTHPRKYQLEVFRTVNGAITKGNAQVKDLPKDYLYPLLEILYTALGQMDNEDRQDYMQIFSQYLDSTEAFSRIISFLVRKTENLIVHVRNDSSNELLSFMEVIDMNNDRYPMMPEYLSQLMLQRFCKNKGNKIIKSKEQLFFENEATIGKILYIDFKEEELQASPNLMKLFSALEARFNEWIMYIVILYEMDLFKDDPAFILVCKGFEEMINVLVDYDNLQNNGHGIERGKALTKPFYPMPTESLYQIFSQFFSKTLTTREKNLLEGKLWAVKAYLNIFCNTKSEIPINKDVLKDVIGFIYGTFRINYFRDYDHDVFLVNCVIIRFTEKIFLLDYPGIKILITPYFKAMEQLLFTENFSQLEAPSVKILGSVIFDGDHHDRAKDSLLSVLTVMKNSALKILKSVLFLGYSFGDLKIASFPETKMDKSRPSMKLVREEMFRSVYRLLEKTKKLKPKNLKGANSSEYFDVEFQYNLFTLGALIIQLECNQGSKPNTTVVDISLEDFIDVFLQQIDLEGTVLDTEYLVLSLRILNTLASLIKDTMKFYAKVYKQIVSIITTTLINILKEPNPLSKKDLVADLFFVLLRWLLGDKRGTLRKEPDLLKDIGNLISTFAANPIFAEELDFFFNNFMMNYMNFPLKNQKSDNAKSIFEEISFKNFDPIYIDHISSLRIITDPKMNRSLSEKVRPSNSKIFTSGPFDDSIITPPIDFSPNKDMETGAPPETLARREEFLTLFKYLWFSKEDEKQLIQMKENDIVGHLNLLISTFNPKAHPKDVLYFSYKDQTLISLVGPSSKSIGGRFIFRNVTGRFAWEFSYIQCLQARAIDKPSTYFGDLSESTLELEFPNVFYEETSATKMKFSSLQGELSPKKTVWSRDVFGDLFEYVRDHVAEYEEYDPKEEEEAENGEIQEEEIKFEQRYEKAVDFEGRRLKVHIRSSTHDFLRRKDIKTMTQTRMRVPLDLNYLKLGGHDGIRMLFSQLKLLTLSNDMELSTLKYEKNNAYLTTMNLLDSAPARESIKIGVIYVARGQDNQTAILKNCSGSKRYQEFLDTLGEKVYLRSHLGFQAGLKYSPDEENSIYFSNPLIEIMFHVATMMPTEMEDDQVLNKKKHIGNDHVTIIWCDNYREYRRNTITSQFNFVQIIIYPLKCDLFRISVKKKDAVNCLFPWIDNMIISKEYLAALVRLCAIHGFRRSRQQKYVPSQAYQKRSDYLKQFHGLSASNNIMSQVRGREDPWAVLSSLLPPSSSMQNG